MTHRRIGTFFISILAVALILSGCEASQPDINIRSGDAENTFVEEPVPPQAQQYSAHLEKSNDYLNLILQKNYAAFYEDMDSHMRGYTTADALGKMHEHIIATYGTTLEHKPQQWWFIKTTERGTPILVSRKLVRHEKALIAYDFIFSPDKKDMKPIGFFIQDKYK